jgi:dienelactone hydrolase
MLKTHGVPDNNGGTKMRAMLVVLAMACTAATCVAGVTGKPVEYTTGGVTLKGYLAMDETMTGKRPAVLVVHEWWGHNAYARRRAEMLAGLGYVALAVDMYGDGKQASHPEDAGKFAMAVMKDMPAMKARFLAAMDFVKSLDAVDSTRIAAIGYCFGGGVVLAMARLGTDLKAVVSFHGSLATTAPAVKGAVKARVLVCNGGADKFIPPEDIKAFKQEMNAAGAVYTFVSYPGAKHSFTNPDATELGKQFMLPLEYNAKADTKSWAEMKQFLKKAFAR